MKVTRGTRLALMMAAAGMVCCAGAGPLVKSGKFQVSQKWFEEDLQKIKPGAAVALRCPQEQLETVVTRVDGLNDRQPITIDVTGCGKKIVYREGFGYQWAPASAATDVAVHVTVHP